MFFQITTVRIHNFQSIEERWQQDFNVMRSCPNIHQLSLGRCTIFNKKAACYLWVSFPFDHDLYIPSEKIKV